MNKICTDVSQSKKLLELGVDVNTADMIYNILGEPYVRNDTPIDEYHTPAWSLVALLKLIPNWQMQTQDNGIGILFGCKECIKIIDADTPIDAAFEMVVWLKENDKLWHKN